MRGDERIDLRLRRRESGEVVAEPADERLRLGGGAAGQFLFGQLGVDETVDVDVLEFFGERLERPPGLVGALGLSGGLIARVDGPGLDPGGEVGDDGVGQLGLLRRHLEVGLEVADRAQEESLVWLARDDDRFAGIPAFLPAGLGVEVESALHLLGLGAVAFVALLDEHRTDLLLEESRAGGIVGRGETACREQEEGGDDSHARIGLMTWPWTSVKRRFTPLW